MFFLYFNFLKSYGSPFCGATDIPLLVLWLHLFWISKPGWVVLFLLVEAYIYATYFLRSISGSLDGQPFFVFLNFQFMTNSVTKCKKLSKF